MQAIKISSFKSFGDGAQSVNLDDHILSFKGERYKDRIEEIRRLNSLGKEKEVKALKLKLPNHTPSSIIHGIRSEANIEDYTKIVALDIDGVDDSEGLRTEICQDEYVRYSFISPSGKGVKVYVQVDSDLEHHLQAWTALKEYFQKKYLNGVHTNSEVDDKPKNPASAQFDSYDSELCFNPDAKVFHVEIGIDRSKFKPTKLEKANDLKRDNYKFSEENNHKTVKDIVKFLNEKNLSITYDYGDWFAVGNSLVTVFNYEDGREYFHQFSKMDEDKYDEIKADQQWDHSWNDENNKYSFGTIIHLAKEAGWNGNKYPKFWKKEGKSKLQFDQLKLARFLEYHGYGLFQDAGGYSVVYVKDNIVHEVGDQEIFRFLREFFEGNQFVDTKGDEILNGLMKGTRNFLSSDKTKWLRKLDIVLLNDTPELSYVFYKNGWIEISKHDIRLRKYSELPAMVWRSDIIKREFDLTDFADHDFYKFLQNITGGDQKRLLSLMNVIGYNLHRYKNPSRAVASIFIDEKISEFGEANGGTGKSRIGEAISKIRNVVTEDGKNFKFGRFSFQKVDRHTDIINIDDADGTFDFKKLFPSITGNMEIEKKNQKAFTLQAQDSPKFIISSNDIIGGNDPSEERRKHEIEISDHYSLARVPEDDFGRLFYVDWDEQDWKEFDSLMCYCVSSYLNEGLTKYDVVNKKERYINTGNWEWTI